MKRDDRYGDALCIVVIGGILDGKPNVQGVVGPFANEKEVDAWIKRSGPLVYRMTLLVKTLESPKA